ncbi:hypothetical protein [Azoarcus sp. DN11]|uniref:hypothetical protein n=1 Tax=Azoarcus sp. DN11 TaxID=356837 RepID=UPI000EADB32A|nr:hypothetical protein [Azoarcus sp. DN11]AYH46124.1 hypothetical protein CDA09_22560 [Azoarcus sp. DN11]
MKIRLLMGLLALVPTLAMGQVVQVKGVGTSSYSGELSPTVKEASYQKAQVSAVERYFAENGEAESKNFEAIADQIAANLDNFILSTTILNEQDQPSLKKYSVAVKVELNVAKLRNTLRKSSVVGTAGAYDKSPMVYVFVGREAASVRAFDTRVVKREEITAKGGSRSTSATRGNEGEDIGGTSISTSATKETSNSRSASSSVRVETGGSATRKADDVTYRLLPMANAKTSITSVFSQAGFRVEEPEFVIGDREFNAMTKEFSAGNDIAPATMRSIVGSLTKAQVPLLVLATLDVGAADQDPATGMQRVAVTTVGRVLDVSSGRPREVASVPAVQYFGVGSDNQAAINKGLKEASLAAAREVVSRLNAVGTH